MRLKYKLYPHDEVANVLRVNEGLQKWLFFFFNFKSMRKFDHRLSNNKGKRVQVIATTKEPLILIGAPAKCDSNNVWRNQLTKYEEASFRGNYGAALKLRETRMLNFTIAIKEI